MACCKVQTTARNTNALCNEKVTRGVHRGITVNIIVPLLEPNKFRTLMKDGHTTLSELAGEAV